MNGKIRENYMGESFPETISRKVCSCFYILKRNEVRSRLKYVHFIRNNRVMITLVSRSFLVRQGRTQIEVG